MEWLGLLAFVFCFFAGGWCLVKYLRYLQDTTDRRYPESTDDGRLGAGGC